MYLFVLFYCQLGNNPSSVGGINLNKGNSVSLGPGGMFCLLGDSYQHFIYFNSASSEGDISDEEPSAKKARCDTLSDSDDDNLTTEDLDDIRREFGQEMVEKIRREQRENKLQDHSEEVVKQENLTSPALKDSWEDIDGKLIIFASKGMEARSKVSLPKIAYNDKIR